jgi:hypothetical protein
MIAAGLLNRIAFGRILAFALAVALVAPFDSAARAANVTVGNYLLKANTANQTITIQVTGGEQVAGEDFFAQIGDGGAFNGGVNTKPVFSNVDILGGTIFASNNTGAQPDLTPHPLIWDVGTITASSTVSANGLLATLTIDTTGLNSGTFPLLLTGVASNINPNNNTTLNGATGSAIPLTVTNGTIMVSTLPLADFSHNGIVDAADYTIWRDSMGQTGTGLAADADGNHVIDQTDYNIWKSQFGYVAAGASGAAAGRLSAGAAVPEPSAAILLVAAMLGVIFAQRSGVLRCRG